MAAVAAVVVVIRIYSPSPAQKALQGVRLEGFIRFQSSDSNYDGNTDATGLYIGPSTADEALIATFNGAGLSLHSTNPQQLGIAMLQTDSMEIFALGEVNNQCRGDVKKFLKTKPVDPAWRLSASDASAVQSGRLEVVELDVTCGGG
ncbi:hypothetical protein KGA66_26865 [Actinocrinis puniceicyclus]|uniref:Uncharacterized protein n=1 Tax=Actinocrinis puniceicyclus TaxID=977794 RepID=A0A8J7WQL3_9ACTN|nr:hypothetical protein [Actinocrinis puniceicyclus]MBS2966688.1 hypothetical protein [Actinocrinis puniceicyclus]